MIISSLELTNFRNYSKKNFEFDPLISVFIGRNGIGKTNILEAIYLLATGDSWRVGSTEEMIEFEKEVAHINSTLKGQSSQNGGLSLQIALTRGFVQGKPSGKILYKIKSVPRRRSDFVGQLKVVLFEPESLEIVIGDPGRRRAFLDEVLVQTDPEYVRSSLIYQKSLRTRNRLLQLIRENKSNLESLEYWERALIKHGTYIQDQRRELIDWLNSSSQNLASKGYSFCAGILAEYQPNIISENRLEQYRQNEILAGHTFTGPQRDDIVISQIGKLEIRKLSQFGSRGEQRMAVLQLKLLEAKWIEEKTGDQPIILLDDIYSELDEEHEKIVGELIKGKQAIITATELHKGHYPEGKVIQL